jgi:hypothetical protein
MLAAEGLEAFTGPVWQAALQMPGLFGTGLFFAYKLFWILLALFLWVIWRKRDGTSLLRLLAITIFPVALTLFAWDTTRVAGFGWLGMAIALTLFLKETPELHYIYQYSAIALLCANLLIPSYNVVMFAAGSPTVYPYPGLYRILDSFIRQIAL